MNKFVTENYRFKITVVKAGGCRNGHEVGDTYSCEYGCPGELCQKTMLKLFPLMETIRCGGDLLEHQPFTAGFMEWRAT